MAELQERIKELEAVVQEKDELIEEMNSQLSFAESEKPSEELQKELIQLKEELEETKAGQLDAGGAGAGGEAVEKLTEEIETLKAKLKESLSQLSQHERSVAELKEDKNNTEALIEEWTVQRETERTRANEAVEKLEEARNTMRKLGIKLENDDTGDTIEDPVAAAFREKEEKWHREREVLEKQMTTAEQEAAVLKEENEKLMEQFELERAQFEETSATDRDALTQKVQHFESLLFGVEENQKGQQLASKVRQHMRMLQQQQQQLVGVHRRLLGKHARLESTNREQGIKLGAFDSLIQNLECDNRTLAISTWDQQQRHHLELDHMQQQLRKLENGGVDDATPTEMEVAFEQAQQQLMVSNDELGEIFDDDDGNSQAEPAPEPTFTPLVPEESAAPQKQAAAPPSGAASTAGSFFGSFFGKKSDVTDV
jgi:chromosome segregation ATPase